MLWTLFLGLVIGAIAKMLMPGKDAGGLILTMSLGVAGALLAHYIGTNLGWYEEGGPAGFVAEVCGSILLLVIYRAVIGRKQIANKV